MFTIIIFDMSGRSNLAIANLQRTFRHECDRFARHQAEMDKLEDAYFRYRDLLRDQEEARHRILKLLGTLGVHSPDVSKRFAEKISPTPISSLELRQNGELKLWEMIDLFLMAIDDKATVSEIRSFLIDVSMSDTTPQAINSAIKTHPESFEDVFEGNERFVRSKLQAKTGKERR